MEPITTPQQPQTNPVIDETIKGFLLESSKWGKFLAIMGYVFMCLFVLMGIIFTVGMSFFDEISEFQVFPAFMGILYIAMAVLYYFPVTYLYRFSVQIKQGLESADQEATSSGIGNLKSMFKFMGIFMIVMLSIYGLAIIIAVPAAIIIGMKSAF